MNSSSAIHILVIDVLKIKGNFEQRIRKIHFVKVFYSTSIVLVSQEVHCSYDQFNNKIIKCQMFLSLK